MDMQNFQDRCSIESLAADSMQLNVMDIAMDIAENISDTARVINNSLKHCGIEKGSSHAKDMKVSQVETKWIRSGFQVPSKKKESDIQEMMSDRYQNAKKKQKVGNSSTILEDKCETDGLLQHSRKACDNENGYDNIRNREQDGMTASITLLPEIMIDSHLSRDLNEKSSSQASIDNMKSDIGHMEEVQREGDEHNPQSEAERQKELPKRSNSKIKLCASHFVVCDNRRKTKKFKAEITFTCEEAKELEARPPTDGDCPRINKLMNLGQFETEREAALAVDKLLVSLQFKPVNCDSLSRDNLKFCETSELPLLGNCKSDTRAKLETNVVDDSSYNENDSHKQKKPRDRLLKQFLEGATSQPSGNDFKEERAEVNKIHNSKKRNSPLSIPYEDTEDGSTILLGNGSISPFFKRVKLTERKIRQKHLISKKPLSNKLTKFHFVHKGQRDKKFQAKISFTRNEIEDLISDFPDLSENFRNSKILYIGRFDNDMDAAQAVDEKLISLKFSPINLIGNPNEGGEENDHASDSNTIDKVKPKAEELVPDVQNADNANDLLQKHTAGVYMLQAIPHCNRIAWHGQVIFSSAQIERLKASSKFKMGQDILSERKYITESFDCPEKAKSAAEKWLLDMGIEQNLILRTKGLPSIQSNSDCKEESGAAINESGRDSHEIIENLQRELRERNQRIEELERLLM